HPVTPINAGAAGRLLAVLCLLVEPLGDLRTPRPGVGKLLAGGNDGEARGAGLRELALDPVEPTARRVQEDAAQGFAHLRACVGPDHDVRRRSVHYVRQLLAYTVVVEIDSGDDLQIVLLERAAS